MERFGDERMKKTNEVKMESSFEDRTGVLMILIMWE